MENKTCTTLEFKKCSSQTRGEIQELLLKESSLLKQQMLFVYLFLFLTPYATTGTGRNIRRCSL